MGLYEKHNRAGSSSASVQTCQRFLVQRDDRACHIRSTEGPTRLVGHPQVPSFLSSPEPFCTSARSLFAICSYITRAVREQEKRIPGNRWELRQLVSWNLQAKHSRAKTRVSFLLFFSLPWPDVTSLLILHQPLKCFGHSLSWMLFFGLSASVLASSAPDPVFSLSRSLSSPSS